MRKISKCFAIASLLLALPITGAQTLGRPHPYLLYTDVDIQQYRERIGSSPADKAAYDDLLEEASDVVLFSLPPFGLADRLFFVRV